MLKFGILRFAVQRFRIEPFRAIFEFSHLLHPMHSDLQEDQFPVVMFKCGMSFFTIEQKPKLVPEEEWDAFIVTLRKPLATTFRIHGW